jgi:hypothetical protein
MTQITNYSNLCAENETMKTINPNPEILLSDHNYKNTFELTANKLQTQPIDKSENGSIERRPNGHYQMSLYKKLQEHRKGMIQEQVKKRFYAASPLNEFKNNIKQAEERTASS